MADIGQVVATGVTTIVGVSLGAGLTYLFGSMNRRHQEAREDETRWHSTKLEAYAEFLSVAFHHIYLDIRARAATEDPEDEPMTTEDYKQAALALNAAWAPVRIVGSPEVIEAANHVVALAIEVQGGAVDPKLWSTATNVFVAAARRDLGHFDYSHAERQ